jgi:hypothetical protein
MSDKKYLHVGFLIEDKNLWDVLRLLEAHKIGQPEVRHVPPPLLALPAPDEDRRRDKRGYKLHNTVTPKVSAAMGLKDKVRVPMLAAQLGENRSSVYSSMAVLMRRGIVKRVGYGLFMRVKLDDQMNGASE